MSLEDSLARLSPALPSFEAGHVWLAGAGPGAPGCLTLDVVSALSQADAIIYDALVDASILSAARLHARLPLARKRGGDAGSARQDDITALLIHLARERLRVLRLKGGDPYVFG